MVFQDTFGSLDPRMTITDILTEPFTLHREVLPKERWNEKVQELLKLQRARARAKKEAGDGLASIPR